MSFLDVRVVITPQFGGPEFVPPKKQVEDALAILKPAPGRREEVCRKEIALSLAHILNVVGDDSIRRAHQSKSARSTLRRLKGLLEALLRVKLELPPIDDLVSATLYKEVILLLPSIRRRSVMPARRPRRSSTHQRVCTQEAHDLLKRYGYEPVTTNGGNWDLLARVLFGNKKISLQRHIVVRDPNNKRGPRKKRSSG